MSTLGISSQFYILALIVMILGEPIEVGKSPAMQCALKTTAPRQHSKTNLFDRLPTF
jgi:hypothetical protein